MGWIRDGIKLTGVEYTVTGIGRAGELNLRDRIASQLKTLKGIQYAA